MSVIEVKNLNFSYPGALHPVFENVSLYLDTAWRLGLVGRNGRGKTTFLNLLLGKLHGTGQIVSAETFEYFPPAEVPEGETAMEVAKASIAPFARWEAEMEKLMAAGSEESIRQYGEIEEQYAAADGYTIEESIAAEAGRLGIHASALERPFKTLSGGERVKLLLAALFLKKHRFLLIDEPTDHLDMEGRRTVARWLKGKAGFILVSHDRAFLDEAVDHILSINRTDIELQQGNYASWRENRDRQDAFELAENQKREGNIRKLEAAAAQTRRWSDAVEKSKKTNSSYDGGSASADKGYIGHQAARMMQRSKSIARRQEREISEQKGLLKNLETTEPIRFQTLPSAKKRLLTAQKLGLELGGRQLFSGLDFTLDVGERVAVTGTNGCGKSSLLRLVLGQLEPSAGSLQLASGLVVSTLPQETEGLRGPLQDFAQERGLEVPLFFALLRKLDFERLAFEQDMASYSAGQKKKVYLAASLATPAHLFVWDEPLNYIDVLSREQIEHAVLDSCPTMLFVEHDAAFLHAAATRSLEL